MSVDVQIEDNTCMSVCQTLPNQHVYFLIQLKTFINSIYSQMSVSSSPLHTLEGIFWQTDTEKCNVYRVSIFQFIL